MLDKLLGDILGHMYIFANQIVLVFLLVLYLYSSSCYSSLPFSVLGGLLAAHLLIVDPTHTFGSLRPIGYDNELLSLSHDLANRLLQAFGNTKTGLPWPRV